MGLIKKNLTFFILLLVFLLVFGAGIFLALGAKAKAAQAARDLRSAEMQINGLLAANPAPTAANLDASQANVDDLRAQLAGIRENLQRGSSLSLNSDGVQVMAAIQQYIASNRRRVAGGDSPIATPDNFAFGFELYARESTAPAEQFIPLVDKQRQILQYLLDKLIPAGPTKISAIRRERIEAPAAAATQKTTEGFVINPAISARVPGAVDTLAFQLTFTGYTDVLRQFLNGLATFEMPIVVRSIEVKRPDAQKAAPKKADDIFSIFGAAAPAAETVEQTEEQRPVIEENLSEFTVTVEFIEIVLPPAESTPARPDSV